MIHLKQMQSGAFTLVLAAANRSVNIHAIPGIYEILLCRLQHLFRTVKTVLTRAGL